MDSVVALETAQSRGAGVNLIRGPSQATMPDVLPSMRVFNPPLVVELSLATIDIVHCSTSWRLGGSDAASEVGLHG